MLPNIIPNEGYMRGADPRLQRGIRQLFIRRLNEISKGVAESLGGTAVVDCQSTGLATVNDLTVGSEMEGYLKELLGDDHVSTCEPSMGSEDFSEVISRVPGVLCAFPWAPVRKVTASAATIPRYVSTTKAYISAPPASPTALCAGWRSTNNQNKQQNSPGDIPPGEFSY